MDNETWTVKRILESIEGYLSKHDDPKPRASAQWLVAEALGLSRMELFMDLDRPLTADERDVLREFTRRRGTGEPLQYITGTVDFRYVTVKVRPGVLIPRPETEVLVSEALSLLPAPPRPQDEFDARIAQMLNAVDAGEAHDDDAGTENSDTRTQAPEQAAHERSEAEPRGLLVADICTGSGCIACSIAYEHPATRVIATDLSPDAVSLARDNITSLNLGDRVEVFECDLGSGIDPALMGSFDLVVSNPPYVPSAVLADIPREVSDFEPALALDGGTDGLDVFRRLLGWCMPALTPGGAFAFELHETCLEAAASEAQNAGFCDVRTIADLAGRPRVLTARKPSDSAAGHTETLEGAVGDESR